MKSDMLKTHNFYFFLSNGRKWGIDISAIREVGELTESLCPVPHAQHSVMGYINVRGDIYQLISFKSLISGKKEKEGKDGLVLFLKESVGQAMGVYVDDACEISAVDITDIEKWEAAESTNAAKFDMAEYLTSSVLRNESELVPLIDPSHIETAISMTE